MKALLFFTLAASQVLGSESLADGGRPTDRIDYPATTPSSRLDERVATNWTDSPHQDVLKRLIPHLASHTTSEIAAMSEDPGYQWVAKTFDFSLPPEINHLKPSDVGWPKNSTLEISGVNVAIEKRIVGRWMRDEYGVGSGNGAWSKSMPDMMQLLADKTATLTFGELVEESRYTIFYSISRQTFSVHFSFSLDHSPVIEDPSIGYVDIPESGDVLKVYDYEMNLQAIYRNAQQGSLGARANRGGTGRSPGFGVEHSDNLEDRL